MRNAELWETELPAAVKKTGAVVEVVGMATTVMNSKQLRGWNDTHSARGIHPLNLESQAETQDTSTTFGIID